ncbi:MAG: FKBP-type peptidyl-prolyl cis-trans isomerase [Bacteroidetes bacterium]|nr:FKBP-type peptidyl-prolyl cis-trans isomerase [Bacteroidota bacterium]
MKNFLIALGAAGTILFASCGGHSRFPGYDEAENGTYFKLLKKGDGTVTVDTGGAVFVKIKFMTAKDSVFLDINERTHAVSYPMRVDKSSFKGDFLDMFTRLHVGDSATFFISLDSLKAHYKDEFKFEPRYDTMKYLGFAVKIDSIYPRTKVQELRSKAEAEQKVQQEMMAKQQAVMQPIQEKAKALEPMLKKKDATLLKPYLAANKITAKPDENGVYYQEILAGTGPGITQGNVVSVRYVGKYLDGTMFDTNTLIDGQEPMTFQMGDGRLIPGFTNAVAKMKKGGKSTFILPSKMGYNDSLTRVFDVEVIDVKEGGPIQQQGPGQRGN